MRRGGFATFAVMLTILSTAQAEWPQFRGPQGDGHSAAKNLPETWNAFRNIAWQTPLPGSGWSSPVIVGDRIWLTAAEPTALTTAEQARKLASFPDDPEGLQGHGAVALMALEVDADSGRLLRRIALFAREDPPLIHASNTYASPTPVTDGERLYCHFGSLGTVAVDLKSGQLIWQQRFVVDEITGGGNSPILWHDFVIFACDGADAQFVVALDRRTGQVAWKTPRPTITAVHAKHKRAFSTPLLVRHANREQIVVPGAQWIVSYDPKTGHELWRVNYGDGHAIVPRPVFRDGIVYCCSGYPKPQLWAVKVDGDGDVTETHVVWIYDRQVPEISSPIIVGQEIYLVSAIGVISCVDARTGERYWQQRLGGNFGASPLFADGKLYFTSDDGTTTVLRPGRQYQELARNQAAGLHMASAAVYRESILLRSSEGIYCVREQ